MASKWWPNGCLKWTSDPASSITPVCCILVENIILHIAWELLWSVEGALWLHIWSGLHHLIEIYFLGSQGASGSDLMSLGYSVLSFHVMCKSSRSKSSKRKKVNAFGSPESLHLHTTYCICHSASAILCSGHYLTTMQCISTLATSILYYILYSLASHLYIHLYV